MHIDLPCCVILPLFLFVGIIIVRGHRDRRRREGWGDDSMTSSYCHRCGHEVIGRPGARFCPECGAPLDA